jgi:hypothetical protein
MASTLRFVADDGRDETATDDRGQSTSATEAAATAWHRWTIAVAALVALVVSLLLLVGDGLAGVLNNLGGPQSAGTWIGVAAVGHGVLALASIVLLGVGLANSRRRRAAVLAAWAIIPVGVGWFVLCGRLASA